MQNVRQILVTFEHESTDKINFEKYLPVLYNRKDYSWSFINKHRNLT